MGLAPSSCPEMTQREVRSLQPGRGLTNPELAVLRSLASRTVRNKFVVYTPLSPWYFVIATLIQIAFSTCLH